MDNDAVINLFLDGSLHPNCSAVGPAEQTTLLKSEQIAPDSLLAYSEFGG